NNFFLMISLEKKKKNNGFRLLPNGRESFCKVIENIDRLQKDYPNFFRKRVFFNAVLHRKNSFKEIKDFFMKRYEKIPSISEVNPVGIEPEKYNDFLKIYRSKNEKSESNKCVSITMKKNIEPSINELRKLIRHYNKYIVWEFSELYYSLKKTRLPTGTCIPFTRRIFITAQGVILPCERVGHQFSLGRFHEDISIDVNAISNNYNSYFDKMSVLCEKCYLNKLCDQCIFQLNLDSSTPTCPNFMNKKKFMEYLSNQISLLEKQPKQYFNIFNETLGID
ncbi:MAG: hypothetical protein MI975_02035, partial [Cytophagales bacterium]|nr:hypothetical protein [Cytophagales bacterium]